MSPTKAVLVIWATLAFCLMLASGVEHWLYLHAKYQRTDALLGYFEARVVHLEQRGRLYEYEYQQCMARTDELQEWREHVTVASRLGWSQANRFIAQYPLDAGPIDVVSLARR